MSSKDISKKLSPFKLFRGSSTTGYKTLLLAYDSELEVWGHNEDHTSAMQGTFTEGLYRGSQGRETALNTALDTELTRAEQWRLTVSPTDLKIYPPEYDSAGVLNADLPRANYSTGPRTSINVQNILNKNYQNDYELLLTGDRSSNNRHFVVEEGLGIGYGQSPVIEFFLDYDRPQRLIQKKTLATRFSAPGSPETAGDTNGGLGLDIESAQFSPYNALPWRNLTVRGTPSEKSGLNYFLSQHEEGGGTLSGVSPDDYDTDAAFHKVNRNPLSVPSEEWNGLAYIDTPKKVYDNWYVNHAIPRTDLQYSWLSRYALPETYYGYSSEDDEFEFPEGAADLYTIGGVPQGIFEPVNSKLSLSTLKKKDFVPVNGFYFADVHYPIIDIDSSFFPNTGTPFLFRNTELTDEMYSKYGLDALSDVELNTLYLQSTLGLSGWSSWEQLRSSENNISYKKSKKNSKYTIPEVVYNGRVYRYGIMGKDEYNGFSISLDLAPGNQNPSNFYNFTWGKTEFCESSVGFFKPTVLNIGGEVLCASVENQFKMFVNDAYTRYYGAEHTKEGLESFLLLLKSEDSFIEFSKRIFPKDLNVSLERSRKKEFFRNTYWRPSRAKRSESGPIEPYTGRFGNKIGFFIANESIWGLDGALESSTQYRATENIYGGEGLLQQRSRLFVAREDLLVAPDTDQSGFLLPGPSFIRRIQEVTSNSGPLLSDRTEIWSGESGYEAHLSGNLDFQPFPKGGYESYVNDSKIQFKDRGQIPEFHISKVIKREEHVAISEEGFTDPSGSIFVFEDLVVPGLTSESSRDAFFSTSPLLTHDGLGIFEVFPTGDLTKLEDLNSSFTEVVVKENVVDRGTSDKINRHILDLTEPEEIEICFDLTKKFMPYEGFYPSERISQISQLFKESYNDAWTSPMGGEPSRLNHFWKYILNPGIIFNSIKSGLGVSVPAFNMSTNLNFLGTEFSEWLADPAVSSQDDGVPRISTRMGGGVLAETAPRVPFEISLAPEKMSDFVDGVSKRLFFPEPHPSASFDYANYGNTENDYITPTNVVTSKLYTRAINNFYSETVKFFLEDESMTKIRSSYENESGVFEAENGATYIMDLFLLQTTNNPGVNLPSIGYSSDNFYHSMGTKPRTTLPSDDSQADFENNFLRGWTFGPPVESATAVDTEDYGFRPYTPPYYNGDSFARFSFTATKPGLAKYSLEEIFEDMVVEKYRNDGLFASPPDIVSHNIVRLTGEALGKDFDSTNYQNQMQIDDCIRLFTKKEYFTSEVSKDGKTTVEPNDKKYAWVMEPKWECPILNFIDAPALTSPSEGVVQNLGLWHQKGRPPTESEGVFLSLRDYPESDTIKSLAEMVGFRTGDYRVGEIAERKTIEEAVITIPFLERGDEQIFIPLNREAVTDVLEKGKDAGRVRGLPEFLIDGLLGLKKYHLPRPLDFINDSKVSPFFFYLFETTETLDKEDLSNIWQGLPPKASMGLRSEQKCYRHKLEDFGDVDLGALKNPHIRFLSFKLKFQGEKLYANIITGSEENDKIKSKDKRSGSVDPNYSYNWPYDYFSTIETGKLTVKVKTKTRKK